ncbi:MmgE/PrpD family protein, partial [Thermodesulfobacteriota bacterium]
LYEQYHQGRYDSKILTEDLGTKFEGTNVSIKPYPCCRGIHVFIDASLGLVNEHNIKREMIQKVTIFSGEGDYKLLCLPLETKCRPRNFVDAQFSIPYGVATAIARGKVTREAFNDEAVSSQDIIDVLEKIEVKLDASLSGGKSHKNEPGKVQILTKDEKIYSNRVDDPLGSPQKPMSYSDCAEKFSDCVSYPVKRVSDENIERVIKLVKDLEDVEDIREVIKLLSENR